jgi:hypothetical protein
VTPRTEGTFQLDGLVEGPAPADAVAARRLEEWAGLMKQAGISLSLEVDGSRFSFLPDPTPRTRTGPAGSLARTIRDALQQLVDGLPPALRPEVFSTLRSVEVGSGFEIQTAYIVGRQGTIETRDRTVEIETTPPTTHRRVRVKMVAMALVGVAAVAALSTLVVDYRTLFRRLWERVTPVAPSEIAVDAGAFRQWMRGSVREVDDDQGLIFLEIAPTESFPKGPNVTEAAAAVPASTFEERLALNALATGYIRCEIFDKDRTYLASASVRVRGLGPGASVVTNVPLPRGPKPRTLVLVP